VKMWRTRRWPITANCEHWVVHLWTEWGDAGSTHFAFRGNGSWCPGVKQQLRAHRHVAVTRPRGLPSALEVEVGRIRPGALAVCGQISWERVARSVCAHSLGSPWSSAVPSPPSLRHQRTRTRRSTPIRRAAALWFPPLSSSTRANTQRLSASMLLASVPGKPASRSARCSIESVSAVFGRVAK
jgi:hypothetical protein